jgi:hypothetical protein
MAKNSRYQPLLTNEFDERDSGLRCFQGFINAVLITFYVLAISGLGYIIIRLFS